MPNVKVYRRDFNTFHVSYGITNPSGKDLVRIEFFNGDTKVGQALLGDAIPPGSFAALHGNQESTFFSRSAISPIYSIFSAQISD